MALQTFSYSIAAQGDTNPFPENITVGTSAPGSLDIELRVLGTNVPDIKTILKYLKVFERRLEDMRYGPSDAGSI